MYEYIVTRAGARGSDDAGRARRTRTYDSTAEFQLARGTLTAACTSVCASVGVI